jgi:hypothetical protein
VGTGESFGASERTLETPISDGRRSVMRIAAPASPEIAGVSETDAVLYLYLLRFQISR